MWVTFLRGDIFLQQVPIFFNGCLFFWNGYLFFCTGAILLHTSVLSWKYKYIWLETLNLRNTFYLYPISLQAPTFSDSILSQLLCSPFEDISDVFLVCLLTWFMHPTSLWRICAFSFGLGNMLPVCRNMLTRGFKKLVIVRLHI